MFLGIFSWGVVAIAFSILISAAIALEVGFMNLPYEPTLVRIFFSSAFVILLVRAGWWLGFQQPKEDTWIKPVIGAVLVFGMIGGLWVASMKWVAAKENAKKANRFKVSLVNMVFGGQYFAFRTEDGDLYRIDVLLNIDLVNQDTVLAKINDYSAQIQLGDDWVWLQRIPVWQKGEFYFGIRQIDKASCISFNLKTIDEQIGHDNIGPGETISGLLAFYIKVADIKKHGLKEDKKITLILFDSLQHKEEHIMDTRIKKEPSEGPSMGWASAMGFTFVKTEVDLSNARIMNSQ